MELRAANAESGATYGSPRLQQVLRARGLPLGRNRVIRLIKQDLPRVWHSRADPIAQIGGCIEDFYNTRRLHSTLGYRSPAAFERRRRVAA